jgi:H+-transporting ATPase
VFASEATLYAIRIRHHLWSRPSAWLVLSSVGDLLIIGALAIGGIAMAPLSTSVVVGVLAGAVLYGLLADVMKLWLFARLRIA